MAAESGVGHHLRLVEVAEREEELPSIAAVNDHWQRRVAEDGQLPRHVLEVIGDTTIRWQGRQTELTPDMTRAFNLFLENEGTSVEQRQLTELLPGAEDPLMGALRLYDYVGATAVSWYRRRSAKDWPRNLWGLNPDLTIVDRRPTPGERALQDVETHLPELLRARLTSDGLIIGEAASGSLRIASVALERALLYLDLMSRKALYERHVNGSRVYHMGKSLDLTDLGAANAFHRAQNGLRLMIPQIVDGNFDYRRAGTRAGDDIGRQHVLTYMTQVGLDVPPRATLTELKWQSVMHLEAAMTLTGQQKQLVASVYGLHEAADGRHTALRGVRLSKASLRLIMRRFVAKDEAALQQPESATEILQDIRLSLKKGNFTACSSNEAADTYTVALLKQLQEDNSFRRHYEVLGERLPHAVRRIATLLVRYRQQRGGKIEGNANVDLQVAELFVADVEALLAMGLKRPVYVATHYTPDAIRALYKRYPRFSRNLIHREVDSYVTDPNGRLERIGRNYVELRRVFAGNPNVGAEEICHFAVSRRKDVIEGMQLYLKNLSRLRLHYADDQEVDERVLRNSARYIGSLTEGRTDSAVEAVERWRHRYRQYSDRYRNNSLVDDTAIREIALYWPLSPETGIRILDRYRSKQVVIHLGVPLPGRQFSDGGQTAYEEVADFTPPDNADADMYRERLNDVLRHLKPAEQLAVLLVFGVEDEQTIAFDDSQYGRLLQELGTNNLPKYVYEVILPNLQQTSEVM